MVSNSAPPGPPQGSPQENCGICRLFRPGPAVLPGSPPKGDQKAQNKGATENRLIFTGQTSACKSGCFRRRRPNRPKNKGVKHPLEENA